MRTETMLRQIILLLTIAVWFPLPSLGQENTEPFISGRTPSPIRINGEEFHYEISPLFILPSELVHIEFPSGYECIPSAGTIMEKRSSACTWKAPSKSGTYELTLSKAQSFPIKFQTFVLVPMSKLHGEFLNGYRIGQYSTDMMNKEGTDPSVYEPPQGFIEITPENETLQLTPHFSLGQFLCKQEGGFPKYMVLKEKLLFKLEGILEEVNKEGLRTNSFHIMSGYRTPYYNKLIENVALSRHTFGDAADIFIPHTTQEDYLKNGLKEASFLYRIVNGLEQKDFFRKFIGGMGLYQKTNSHPPFVHVDVRGRPARW